MKILKQFALIATTGLATLALLAGCATQIKDAEQTDQRVEAAKQAFGPGFDYMIIEKGGKLADSVFVNFFNTGADSDLSRKLYARLAPAESKPMRFMVTGENARKTAQVVIEALSFSPANGLKNLELLYLGEQEYVPGIEEAVKRVGGQLRFAPYSG